MLTVVVSRNTSNLKLLSMHVSKEPLQHAPLPAFFNGEADWKCPLEEDIPIEHPFHFWKRLEEIGRAQLNMPYNSDSINCRLKLIPLHKSLDKGREIKDKEMSG